MAGFLPNLTDFLNPDAYAEAFGLRRKAAPAAPTGDDYALALAQAQRKLREAQRLRELAAQPGPAAGQMVSGHYVGNPWGQGVAALGSLVNTRRADALEQEAQDAALAASEAKRTRDAAWLSEMPAARNVEQQVALPAEPAPSSLTRGFMGLPIDEATAQAAIDAIRGPAPETRPAFLPRDPFGIDAQGVTAPRKRAGGSLTLTTPEGASLSIDRGEPAPPPSAYPQFDTPATRYETRTQRVVPTGADFAAWAARNPEHPLAVKAAERLYTEQLDAAFPDPSKRFLQVAGGVFDKDTNSFLESPSAADERSDRAWNRYQQLQVQRERLEEQARQFGLSHDLRQQIAATNMAIAQSRLALAEARAAGGGGAGGAHKWQPLAGQVDDRGRPMFYDKTGALGVADPASGGVVPLAQSATSAGAQVGWVEPAAAGTKRRAEESGVRSQLRQAESLLKQAQDAGVAAFDAKAGIASALPNFIGSRINERALTPAQRQFRASAARFAAREINDLFGAAVSGREDVRARQFAIQPDDPMDVVVDKLNSIARLQREALSDFAADADTRRAQTAPRPAPAVPKAKGVTTKGGFTVEKE